MSEQEKGNGAGSLYAKSALIGAVGVPMIAIAAVSVMGARAGSKVDPGGGAVGAVVGGAAGLALGAVLASAILPYLAVFGALAGGVAFHGEKSSAPDQKKFLDEAATAMSNQNILPLLKKEGLDTLKSVVRNFGSKRLLRVAGMEEAAPEEPKAKAPGL